MDKRKIGIAIPCYNKCDDVLKCIEKIKDDPRIETITIIDDCSEQAISWLLEDNLYSEEGETKIRLGRNDTHLGEELNQHRAVLLSDSEWVLLVNTEYPIEQRWIDKIFDSEWKEKGQTIQFGIGEGNFIFLNRKNYLDNSPHSIHLEKQEEESK